MIVFPTRRTGFSRVDTQSPVSLEVISDWLEASALFTDEEIFQSDVLDVLMGEEIFNSQDEANNLISDAWFEVSRRMQWLGDAAPLNIDDDLLYRTVSWIDASAYAFLLLTSLAVWKRDWSNQFGPNYIDQGEIFESLTEQALLRLYPQWQVFRTGWSRENPVRLRDIVASVTALLGESTKNLALWDHARAKEYGLDMVLFKPFNDMRIGFPIHLIQCASGADWETKRKEPDLDLWDDLIDFAAKPKRGFAVPFALSDVLLRQSAKLVNGLVLDRYRILSTALVDPQWITPDLQQRITDWGTPRIEVLPTYDDA